MRDIVAHEIAIAGPQTQALLSDHSDPERMVYLHRFADQEGKRYLDRFWRDYRGMTAQEALDLLASRTRPNPRRLAAVFRSVRPEASRTALGAFLTRHLPKAALDDDELWDIYRGSSPRTVSLRDRAYIAGVHPLELWLVDYLQHHPAPSRDEVMEASAAARQEVYRWLFDSRSPYTQNLRISMLLEEDAFDQILVDWRRQGYPFAHLVPSDGTAIGSSGDRPDALADLMGIIVNDGVRLPTVSLQRLDFAVGTPYETDLRWRPSRSGCSRPRWRRHCAAPCSASSPTAPAARERRLSRRRWQRLAGRRQDRNRRQPVRPVRPRRAPGLAARRRSHRDLRVFSRRPTPSSDGTSICASAPTAIHATAPATCGDVGSNARWWRSPSSMAGGAGCSASATTGVTGAATAASAKQARVNRMALPTRVGARRFNAIASGRSCANGARATLSRCARRSPRCCRGSRELHVGLGRRRAERARDHVPPRERRLVDRVPAGRHLRDQRVVDRELRELAAAQPVDAAVADVRDHGGVAGDAQHGDGRAHLAELAVAPLRDPLGREARRDEELVLAERARTQIASSLLARRPGIVRAKASSSMPAHRARGVPAANPANRAARRHPDSSHARDRALPGRNWHGARAQAGRTPDDRRGSPDDRPGSPDDRRGSLGDRRGSPDDRGGSSGDRRGSPGDRRGSPGDRRGSPGDRRGTPGDRRGSPEATRRGSCPRPPRTPARSVPAAQRATTSSIIVVGRVGAVMEQREPLRARALRDDHARARRRVAPAAAHRRSRRRRASRRGSSRSAPCASASACGSGSSGDGYSTSVRNVTTLPSAAMRNAGRPHAAVRHRRGRDLEAGQRRASRPARSSRSTRRPRGSRAR